MKPAPFEYHRAHSLAEAIDLLARGGDDAKILAGGQSLVAMMNLRLARPSVLIDINEVPGLSYILSSEHGLRVGALTRHHQVEHYPGLLDGYEVLPAAARWVGHYPIRARGTFGGSIAHADSAAEWCILAALLEAEMIAASRAGQRLIPAAEFFKGLFTTALRPDEILTEVRLTQSYTHASLTEFARRHGDFAIVAAAVGYNVVDGIIHQPRLVLGGVTDRPLVLDEAASVLEGDQPSAELFREAAEAAKLGLDPPADIHGSTEYRRDLAGVLVERALMDAGTR